MPRVHPEDMKDILSVRADFAASFEEVRDVVLFAGTTLRLLFVGSKNWQLILCYCSVGGQLN